MFITRFHPKTMRIPVFQLFFFVFVFKIWPEPHLPQILPGRAPCLCNFDIRTTTTTTKQHPTQGPNPYTHTTTQHLAAVSNMAFCHLHIFRKYTGIQQSGGRLERSRDLVGDPVFWGEEEISWQKFLLSPFWQIVSRTIDRYKVPSRFSFRSHCWVILHTYPRLHNVVTHDTATILWSIITHQPSDFGNSKNLTFKPWRSREVDRMVICSLKPR